MVQPRFREYLILTSLRRQAFTFLEVLVALIFMVASALLYFELVNQFRLQRRWENHQLLLSRVRDEMNARLSTDFITATETTEFLTGKSGESDFNDFSSLISVELINPAHIYLPIKSYPQTQINFSKFELIDRPGPRQELPALINLQICSVLWPDSTVEISFIKLNSGWGGLAEEIQ